MKPGDVILVVEQSLRAMKAKSFTRRVIEVIPDRTFKVTFEATFHREDECAVESLPGFIGKDAVPNRPMGLGRRVGGGGGPLMEFDDD